MSLVTWGWGTCDGIITVCGFGAFSCTPVANILARYLGDKAYTWVEDDRGWIEVITRDKGEVLLRIKPSSVPERLRGDVVGRMYEDAPIRSPGWPWELEEFEGQR